MIEFLLEGSLMGICNRIILSVRWLCGRLEVDMHLVMRIVAKKSIE